MQGKVSMEPLVCAECGRKRLVVAMAPWRAIMLLCRSCKNMTAIDGASIAVTSLEEAASRGLPRTRGGAKANGTTTATDDPTVAEMASIGLLAELEANALRKQDGVDLADPVAAQGKDDGIDKPARRRRR